MKNLTAEKEQAKERKPRMRYGAR